MKNKTLLGRIVAISIVSFSAIAVAISTLAWFVSPGGKTDEQLDGVIGLRGYFYAGNGESEETAFEIVRPVHLYNLSRLQSLGIFTEKTYFQIGHKDEVTGELFCLDENGDRQTYLDMHTFCLTNPLKPIGNEETPFIGEFEGNGIPIKNLVIKGNPEDIGVFGYVAHQGKVNGLVCSHLDIYSLGYQSSVSNLFGQNIDNIFNSNDYLVKETSFHIKEGLSDHELKSTNSNNYNANQTNGYVISDLNISNTAEFYPVFPNKALHPDDRFTYTWKSSSALLRAYDKNNPNKIVIDLNEFPTDTRGGARIDTRLSLIASTKVDNYTYSRVIQSYSFNFELEANRIYKCKTTIGEGGEGTFNPTANWTEIGATVFSPENAYAVGDVIYYKKDNKFYICNTAIPLPSAEEERTFETYASRWTEIDSEYSTASSYNVGDYVYKGGNVRVTILCDYAKSLEEHGTDYHHGTNVGFLAGHVDGSFTKSFVYDGTFHLNDESANFKVEAETDSGLIGEVGSNVVNALDPEYAFSRVGDTGVINFTKIYDGIRSDCTGGHKILAGYTGSTNYMSYLGYVKENGDYYNLYKDYLRYYNSNNPVSYSNVYGKNGSVTGIAYISKVDTTNSPGTAWKTDYIVRNSNSDPGYDVTFNSIDFLWNNVIADGETSEYDRGLGVFKIVTPYNASTRGGNYTYTDHQFDNLGGSQIINGKPKDKVYFSTAEYVHSKLNENKVWVPYDSNQKTWGTGANQILPFRETTIPSYSDSSTFKYPFSRDHNYCFELDLNEMENRNNKNNFMWNTDSDFLKNYLNTVLTSKIGGPVPYKTQQFGFMFRKDNVETLSSLSSYMPIKEPGATVTYGEDEEGNSISYPSSSIVFEIENTNGANVSVVGNQGDITIYSYDPKAPEGSSATPIYTMRSTNDGVTRKTSKNIYTSYNKLEWDEYDKEADSTTGIDYHKYFTYDYTSGHTSLTAKTMNYSSENEYKVGDIVFNPTNPFPSASNGYPYWWKCAEDLAANTPWNPNNWEKISNHAGTIIYDKTNNNFTNRNRKLYQYTYDVPTTSGLTFSKNEIRWKRIDTFMHDCDALYGHIFKLPKGHYVIGAAPTSNGTGKANLYFLAVQGQKKGTIITDNVPNGDEHNVVENVDFLFNEPTYEEYIEHDFETKSNNALSRAFFSFQAAFNEKQNSIKVTNHSIDTNYLVVQFGKTPAFVTYLYLHSHDLVTGGARRFYVNDDSPYEIGDYVYTNLT